MAKHSRKDPASAVLLGILAVIFVALAVLLVFILIKPTDKQEAVSEPVSTVSSDFAVSSEPSSQPESSVLHSSGSAASVSSERQYPNPEDPAESWYLTLVNQQYPLPDGLSVKTTAIKSEFNPYSLKFDSRAVDALNMMLSDAKADGVKMQVISAYRTMEKQTSLYNNKVNYYKEKGYDDAAAKTAAAAVVAIPGTSDHNLGLAVDLDSVETSYENTAQFKWLQKNCVKYGFVLRYPKDKQNITGITYEPWHYRYVGVAAAKEMQEKNICLEEYTEYLKTK